MKATGTTYDFAKLFARFTDRNIFLTGKAGTGKTTFLHQLRESSLKQMAVVAPTGVAAINAGGTTIHSFFQLPLSPFVPTEAGRRELISKMKMRGNRRRVLRELEMLVIDEVSMVRADVMDAIDAVLRSVRYRHNEPFGGVQVILIGDMFQLSPVVRNEEWQILSRFYEGAFFFNSHVFKERAFVHIEFDKIFRQSDQEFITLLNEVRNNRLSAAGRAALDSRYHPGFVAKEDEGYIVLTTHNNKADTINSRELEKLKGKPRIYKAKVEGTFPERNFPAEENLELKIGAKVMFNKNDTENPRRFYNGMIGEVTGWGDNNSVIVKPAEGGDEIDLYPMAWENIQYTADEKTLEVHEEVMGQFVQLPLRLAWAITIHKSQGLTFEKAIIDAGAAFAPGQVYVALSRCRSLEGVVLLSRIDDYAIRNDQEVLSFSTQNYNAEQLEATYSSSSREYEQKLLLSVYDFSTMQRLTAQWLKESEEVGDALGEETADYLKSVLTQVTEINQVGGNFMRQLYQLMNQNLYVEDQLNERLQAAAGYFEEKLSLLSENLKESPATTDSKDYANEYDRYWNDIFTLCEQKRHRIEGIKNGFQVEKYFRVRESFVMPEAKVSAYSRKQSRRKYSDAAHPELVDMLYEVRNYLMDEFNMPIYMVANQKSINEMAEYLPQTKQDLMKISGFGKAKSERFGSHFLEVIRDYCLENNLESAMEELFITERKKKSATRERKKKEPKGSSAKLSLELFKSGKTIEEIVEERKLAYSTIIGHLGQFISTGELDYKQLISDETVDKARSLINPDSQESYYAQLRPHFDSKILNLVVAALRMQV